MIAPVLFMTILMTSWACGKKAPPRLSVKEFPVRVTNLSEEWGKRDLFLKGKIVGIEGRSRASGCRMYSVRYDLEEAPCDECPVEFSEFIEFGPDVIGKKEFSCVVPGVLKSGIYYFRVRLLGEGGTIGPPSKVVKVVIH